MTSVAPPDPFVKAAWTLASIAVVIAALYLAKGVLVPLTLALLLSFLLSPVCTWLERRRLGRIPAVVITAILGFAVLGAATWMAVVQMADLAPRLPEYQDNIQAKLQSVNRYFTLAMSKFTITAEGMSEELSELKPAQAPQGTVEWPYAVRVVTAPASPLQVFGGVFGTLLEGLGSAGMVMILVVFFLVCREDLRDRFVRLVGQGHVTLTTQVLEDAGTRVSRYLATEFLLNAVYGLGVGVGLYFIGVPNAILWGILATTLRFIPYLGPWLAAAMPIVLSMAISTTWVAPGLTIGLFVVLELISNNILEPWLYGKNTGVSAVAVLLAAVFWTWLWGVAGLLLATPLTVCLLVIGKHVPQLAFLDILLGDEPVFEPHKRIYQRLLGRDQERAAELLDESLEHQPLVEVYDTVLLPALAAAETHWHRGDLDESRHTYILQSLKEMIQEQEERQQERLEQEHRDTTHNGNGEPPLADPIPSQRLRVLCVPAHDEGDEIAGMMLTQVLQSLECVVQTRSVTDSESVDPHEVDVICISAAPPAAVMHARQLCRRLRHRFPEANLLVGLWSSSVDRNQAKVRIGHGADVVATLVDAQKWIQRLRKPLPQSAEMQISAKSN